MKEHEVGIEALQDLNRHSAHVVIAGLVLVGVVVGCVYSEGLIHKVLVAAFYFLTIVGYFIGIQFDAAVENASGPIKKLPKAFGLLFALVLSFVIHRWLFWQ